MGNDILEGILRLANTKLLILLLKYITQITEKCIHNAGVGGSSPPVATTPPHFTRYDLPLDASSKEALRLFGNRMRFTRPSTPV